MKLRSIQVEHLSVRVTALVLAIILWFLAAGRPAKEIGLDTRHMSLPIQLVNLDADLAVLESPKEAQLVLEGPRLLLLFQRSQLGVYIDLDGVGPGRHLLPVSVDHPAGIHVQTLEPMEATVVLQSVVL